MILNEALLYVNHQNLALCICIEVGIQMRCLVTIFAVVSCLLFGFIMWDSWLVRCAPQNFFPEINFLLFKPSIPPVLPFAPQR
jgi:hypothetical protein